MAKNENSENMLFQAMGIDPDRKHRSINASERWKHFVKMAKKVGSQARRDKVFILLMLALTGAFGFLSYTILITDFIPLVWSKFGYGTLPMTFLLAYNLFWMFTRNHPNLLLPVYYLGVCLMLVVIPFCGWLVLVTKDVTLGGSVGYKVAVPLVQWANTVEFMNWYMVVLGLVSATGLYLTYPMLASMTYDCKKLYYRLSGIVYEEADFGMPDTKKAKATEHDDLAEVSGGYIVQLLSSFGLKDIETIKTRNGPIIDEYLLRLPAGMKPGKVESEQASLSNSLGIPKIVINTVVPGQRRGISILVPKLPEQMELVRYEDIAATPTFRNTKYVLPMILGKNLVGRPVIIDLQKMKHVLVAGETGAGKSKLVEAMLLSLLQAVPPEEMELTIIDPKRVEMTHFGSVPHLKDNASGSKIITEPTEAELVLQEATRIMDERYMLLEQKAHRISRPVKNITAYNDGNYSDDFPLLRHWVIEVDEYADLMMHPDTDSKALEDAIARLAQKGRAAGIHLILATQRPTVDVITGLIKANMPCRIALEVKTKVDSKVILDQPGAEDLLGNGDMLVVNSAFGALPYRVHGAFIDDNDAVRLLNTL